MHYNCIITSFSEFVCTQISSQCDIDTRSDAESITYLDIQLLVDYPEPIAGCSGYRRT